jgi:hypothetical protein
MTGGATKKETGDDNHKNRYPTQRKINNKILKRRISEN